MLPLSPEIQTKVASFVDSSRRDLFAMCLTCKSLQLAAEPFLYAQLILPTPAVCLSVCRTLAATPRLAQHVRRFVFAPEPRAARHLAISAQTLWTAIQHALEEMTQLDSLVLSDATFSHSWVFSSPALPTRLRELRIRAAWDAHTVAFVSCQRELRLLQVYDAIDDAGALQHRAVALRLPALETFDGTLSIGTQFTGCALRRMQLQVDCESAAALSCLARFGTTHGTLRALSLIDASEDMTVPVLQTVVSILPELRHIGILPYPMMSRNEVHKCLLEMHNLQAIELDLSRWNPLPSVPALQRALADELRVFCPSLRVIVFWMGNSMRVRWAVNGNGNGNEISHSHGIGHGQWQSRGEQGVYQHMGELWKIV